MRKVECIIMDWAGTTVDYGCFAPVEAFIRSFNTLGVDVLPAETRAYMGLSKIEEIRALFRLERVQEAFRLHHGRPSNEDDVQACYQQFQQLLCATLADYSVPLPGVTDTVDLLRRTRGMKRGSTTGYTAAMMDIVLSAAARHGYKPDACVTADKLPAGRPCPYMIFQNMIGLAVPSTDLVVKYGDTIADIKEGVNAKVWTVEAITGSNELGLTEDGVRALPQDELDRRKDDIRRRMTEAGAHYVVNDITELPAVLDDIDRRLNA